MKNKIILFVLALFLIQNCSAQFNDYKKKYNELLPALQKSANNKKLYYGKEFSEFYQNFTVKDKIVSFGYDGKYANSRKLYILRLYFSRIEERGSLIDNKLPIPMLNITFQDQIPDEIIPLTRKYEGIWNEDMVKFFSKLKIEKIEYYGINGWDNKDRRAR